MLMRACPNCGGYQFSLLASARAIRRERRARDAFVLARIGYTPSPAELTDLTRFMHGGPGELALCRDCGVARRLEDGEAGYPRDIYDLDLLEMLYPRYRRAFAAKRAHYLPLLPPRSDVLEVGSHTGAFLENAESWGWRPTGLDIGIDARAFAARHGFRVRGDALHDARLRSGSFDAVFIWNCFEQMDNPVEALRDAGRLLRRGGLLIVRVPNLDFYRRRKKRAFLSLAYQNLLGFPYQLGYTASTLRATLEGAGFQAIFGVDSNLLISPFPAWTSRLEREWKRSLVTEEPRPAERLSGPWIELIARPAADPTPRRNYVC